MSIATLAEKVRSIGWDGRFPIDVERLSNELAIQMYGATFEIKMVSSEGLDNLSSKVEMVFDPYPHFLCLYNSHEHHHRQIFAQAHMLGHVVLGHLTKDRRALEDEQYNDFTYEEAQANEFAMELLMPKDYIEHHVVKLASIDKLAGLYGVSPTAIKHRLTDLRILR